MLRATMMLMGLPPVFGMPPQVLLLAVAVAGMTIGVVWVRRITAVPGEPRSFRATAPPGHDVLALAGLGALLLLVAAVVLLVGSRIDVS